MIAQTRFYAESGRVTFPGLVFGAVTGLTAGSILAVVYAVVLRWSPVVFVHPLVAAGFGYAVGYVVSAMVRVGRTDHARVAVAMGIGGALVAHYVGWMAWVFLVSRSGDVPGAEAMLRVTDPAALVYAMGSILEVGTWSWLPGGDPVNGWPLLVVWVVEAAIVLGGASVGARAAVVPRVYCAVCDSWCEDRTALLTLGEEVDVSALVEEIGSHEFDRLRDARRADRAEPVSYQVDLEVCPGCGATNTLSLSKVTQRGDAVTVETVLAGLLLSQREARWLEELGSSPSSVRPSPFSTSAPSGAPSSPRAPRIAYRGSDG